MDWINEVLDLFITRFIIQPKHFNHFITILITKKNIYFYIV